ncbi:hypothetical protein [Rhizobium leguminosarum]|uniref:hypothetical protein n=1 Tax=Rhizobium leguminosarum TaxID=384 RepID=UPI00143F29E7|nr:hypothetical protein [Rhizobium leguminosarum]NKL24569.1 hypothetical protein [Rhizobium leguminosarum bv. viciae]
MSEQRWWTQTALFPGVLAIATTSWIIPSLFPLPSSLFPPSLSSLAVDLAPSGVGLAVLAISSLGLPHSKRLALAVRRPTVSEF